MPDLKSFSVLDLAHQFLRAHVQPGDLCVDATAGRGFDTALLCELVGESGRVLSFDIQEDAISSTKTLLEQRGLASRAELLLKSHAEMADRIQPETVSAMVFNFGWLPGGNHDIFTRAETSVEAVRQGLSLLKPGGVMSLSIYYGRNNGYGERDALLEFLSGVDSREYTVLTASFANRRGDPPIPAFVFRGK